MNIRLTDVLMLVSRVHERRGDIRFILRQDPSVRREVQKYLDDLSWLTQLPPPQPNRVHMAAGKEQLLATLQGQAKKRQRWSPVQMLALGFSMSLVLSLVVFTQAATTDNMPAPIEHAVQQYVPGGHEMPASPSLDLDFTTPAELALVSSASTGLSR